MLVLVDTAQLNFTKELILVGGQGYQSIPERTEIQSEAKLIISFMIVVANSI
jgi:hypothetical protein